MSLVLVFGVPVDLRWSVIFGWVWLGDFSSDACKIRLCLRRWQFGGAPDVRALANLELSSAPPLLMSRMKMVQLSKWQLVPPTLRDRALLSFIYLQFLLRLCSSLASWPTLHSSATNWLIGGCACLWRETRLSYTQLPTRYLRSRRHGLRSRRHGRPNSWIILFPLTLDKNNLIYITIYVSKQITNLSQNKKQNIKDYV